ncbi:protein CREG1 isoform X2 [Hemicordylus capensis]|uniref:protein CREG1 isoform X1 n=1 Tax=Hemicordylus capensis TaxID=884348 RepID=UPI002302DF35|nr:protein CREG1 isoform X1 [Hemicordylus capensis]XP_053163422.1 protein CREG1 isoform X1 [Hemicordylus capensis]XP_053163423.1 protein CREG1 isoform X2 [Hemicordylus capensis]
MWLWVALLLAALARADIVDIPPHNETARVARYVAHACDWGALATLSTQESPMRGQPFANVFSVSDGPNGPHGSGVPYMYLTDLEISVHDLKVNANASLTMSLAQTPYCKEKGYDPQNPLCAHVIFSGIVEKLENGTAEAEKGKKALFSRHPEMKTWPRDHGWYIARFNIASIWVLDYFGGIKTVTPEEYFKVIP